MANETKKLNKVSQDTKKVSNVSRAKTQQNTKKTSNVSQANPQARIANPQTRRVNPQASSASAQARGINGQPRNVNPQAKGANPQVKSVNPQVNVNPQASSVAAGRLQIDKNELLDLEQINEQNIKEYRYRTKRNRAWIIVLAILLCAAVITICVVAASIYKTNNCFLYTHGNGDATYIVDDMMLNKFRTPADIKGNRLLSFDCKLDIKSTGNYNIRFTVEVYCGGDRLTNITYDEPDMSLFYNGNDGFYYSKQPIQGGRVIQLIKGVYLDKDYESTLDISNFKLEFHTYLDKV